MNNHCVPDWNMEDDSRALFHPSTNQKKSVEPDNELVELFWRNGNIVMDNQAHRKALTTVTELKQVEEPEPPMRWEGSLVSDLIQEEVTTPWFQYPLDDPLEKEFCSEFFSEMPLVDPTLVDKLNKDVSAVEDRHAKFGAAGETSVLTGSAPKQSIHQIASLLPKSGEDITKKFSQFSGAMKGDLRYLTAQLGYKGTGNGSKLAMGASTSTMIGLSACGSNQVQNVVDGSYNFSDDVTEDLMKEDVHGRSPRGVAQSNNHEGPITSSSGGSGCSFGVKEQQNASNQSCKRKRTNGEDSECHSEEAEYKTIETSKSMQRSAAARRSRATEVHNLSERKRRDKINEKMRALQELIPHCNKSDKASMLDEAIQYLKSLQLQVQLMWMGSGMAPMIFPGAQQYMSCMGMAHANLPFSHSQIQLPRVPLHTQSMHSAPTTNHTPFAPQALNAVNFPTQLQNANVPEPYARSFGYQRMQPSPQAMNFNAYQRTELNIPSLAAATCMRLPTSVMPNEKVQNVHSGNER